MDLFEGFYSVYHRAGEEVLAEVVCKLRFMSKAGWKWKQGGDLGG